MSKILFSMVTSVNKWCVFSFLGYFVIIQALQSESNYKSGSHPFHVSTTEINHNATGKTLEISCRVFTDDFESCLSKQYRTKVDLSAANMKTSMDSLVKKYFTTHLHIKTDGKLAGAQYLGFEKENEAVNVFLEADNIVSVKKIEIDNSILHDLYDDQINIVHVVVGGTRKSTKLDYPNKEVVFTF